MKMKKVMIFAALTAMVTMTGCSEKKEASKDVVSFDEVLTTRRSVRSYDASKWSLLCHRLFLLIL